MSHWLLKTEPDVYSWDDLVRDKKTVWDCVANNTALKNIREMNKGDLALIYHTGDERQAIGVAEITCKAYPDPKESNEKMVVVDIKPKKKLAHAIPLEKFKADEAFEGWIMLRIGRLSVVPVPQEMWERIIELSQMRE